MRHDYAREIGERIAHVRGHTSQSAFASEMGVHKNTLGNYERGDRVPDAEFVAGLAQRGYNPQWLLTGEGPELISEQSQSASSDQDRGLIEAPRRSRVDTLDAELLEDVLTVLRDHQDRAGERWQAQHEAALAVEIYQYILEEEGPTPEDRAKVLRLVRSIIGGTTNAGTHTTQGED